MARLPVVGGDNNSWGTLLNDYLGISHNTDGTLVPAQVVSAAVPSVSVQTSDYTAGTTNNEIVLANAASAALIITLPSAVSNGLHYTVKKIDTSSHVVTVATTGSQTIDGGPTAALKVPYVVVTFVSNGSNWNVI